MGRDYDDDDDRPRRRRRGRAPQYKSQTGLIVFVVVGGAVLVLLLLLGGIGFGVYMVTRKLPANAAAPAVGGPPVPNVGSGGQIATSNQTVWRDFRQPDGLYSVKLPLPPVNILPPFSQLKPVGGDQLSVLLAGSNELNCIIKVTVLSPAAHAEHLKNQQPIGAAGGDFAAKRQVNWLGRVVAEEVDPNDRLGRVKRTFLDGNRLYEFTLGGYSRKPTDQELAMFFNSVVLNPR